jgi:hypothetical protein
MDTQNTPQKPALSKKKAALVEQYAAAGWTIIEGNNEYLGKRKKYADYDCVKLVSSKTKGGANFVWAVKEKSLASFASSYWDQKKSNQTMLTLSCGMLANGVGHPRHPTTKARWDARKEARELREATQPGAQANKQGRL